MTAYVCCATASCALLCTMIREHTSRLLHFRLSREKISGGNAEIVRLFQTPSYSSKKGDAMCSPKQYSESSSGSAFRGKCFRGCAYFHGRCQMQSTGWWRVHGIRSSAGTMSAGCRLLQYGNGSFLTASGKRNAEDPRWRTGSHHGAIMRRRTGFHSGELSIWTILQPSRTMGGRSCSSARRQSIDPDVHGCDLQEP
jgi:hypothetical protein